MKAPMRPSSQTSLLPTTRKPKAERPRKDLHLQPWKAHAGMHLRATLPCSSFPLTRGSLPRSPTKVSVVCTGCSSRKKRRPFLSEVRINNNCLFNNARTCRAIFRHQSEMRKWRKQIKTKSVRSLCTNLDVDNLRHKCARVLVASAIRQWNPCKAHHLESEKPSPLRLKKPRNRLHVMVTENNKGGLLKYWDQNLST